MYQETINTDIRKISSILRFDDDCLSGITIEEQCVSFFFHDGFFVKKKSSSSGEAAFTRCKRGVIVSSMIFSVTDFSECVVKVE